MGTDAAGLALDDRAAGPCYNRPVSEEIDRAAVEALFPKHGAMVYRRAYQLLGNQADAEEATQEVFIRAMRRGETFQGRGTVTAWLYRITTHYCLNQIRDRGRRRDLFREHVEPTAPRAASNAQPGDLMTLRWLLANADELQARAAIYVFLDGMSHREAAEQLDVSRRVVGKLLDRFRVWATRQVAQHGDDSRDDHHDQAGTAAHRSNPTS